MASSMLTVHFWSCRLGVTCANADKLRLACVQHASPRVFSYTDHAGIIDISLKGATIHRDVSRLGFQHGL